MRALVCGAGGFIGSHLVERLRSEGCWVRGVDITRPRWQPSVADEFLVLDLTDPAACNRALCVAGGFDEVYQLAADMGGIAFIESAQCEIMRNNALINLNMVDAASAARAGRYFFSSSVCVYRDVGPDEPALYEEDAYPANPDNEYGWEKLYAERAVQAYGRRHGLSGRIGRFENCYGPLGVWCGGREKAPAALCRKIAEAGEGGVVEVWGDGSAVRCFTYIDDVIEGILTLTRSELVVPTNIGSGQYVTVAELVETIVGVAGFPVHIRYVDGPTGVQRRNFSGARLASLGWQPQYTLVEGIERTYRWIEQQVLGAPRSVAPGAQPLQ